MGDASRFAGFLRGGAGEGRKPFLHLEAERPFFIFGRDAVLLPWQLYLFRLL